MNPKQILYVSANCMNLNFQNQQQHQQNALAGPSGSLDQASQQLGHGQQASQPPAFHQSSASMGNSRQGGLQGNGAHGGQDGPYHVSNSQKRRRELSGNSSSNAVAQRMLKN